MIVLVCGGRDYDDWRTVHKTLDRLHREHEFTVLVHGGGDGADTLADEWAHDRLGLGDAIVIRAFRAEWRKYGKSAGPRRNADMLRLTKPDLVVAFPGGKGTADMVNRARKAGVRVVEVTA